MPPEQGTIGPDLHLRLKCRAYSKKYGLTPESASPFCINTYYLRRTYDPVGILKDGCYLDPVGKGLHLEGSASHHLFTVKIDY